MFAARVAVFFGMIALLVLYALDPVWMQALGFSLPLWLRWAGFATGLLRLGLLAWTETALGRQWSAQLQLREGHQLVTSGPYAHVRHPLYSALVGYGGSLALVSSSWPFLVLAAVIAWSVFVRVPKEEQMMLERFGEEYRP